MKKKILLSALALALLMPSASVFAENDEVLRGDISYEEGLYLPDLSVFSNTKGRQVHPFGGSKVGKISKSDKKEILARKNVKKLIDLYNKLYQIMIRWYKFGANNIDRWKEVTNMTDPVFGKINKAQWIKVYESGGRMLQKTRDYFDSLGLIDADYTYEATLKMIDRPEVSIVKTISCGAEDTIVFNQGISSAKLDAQSRELTDANGGKLVKKLVENLDGYELGEPTEVLGKSKSGAYDQRLFVEIYLTRDDSQILFQMAGKDEETWSDYSLKDKKISNFYGQEMLLSSYKEGGLYRAEFKDLDNEYLVESSGISEDEFLVILRSFIANIRNVSALSSMKLEF